LRTYDGENRMTAAQGAGGTWFRYVYDADGKRGETQRRDGVGDVDGLRV
jgi:YD repeat-containing protein